MQDDELEAAIAAYRADLLAEADLGADDLAEVEDHLRELIDELCAAGRSAEIAFAEAVRRLGEPAALAREHARVRPVFGARPSRARAWSAALLIAPFLVMRVSALFRSPLDDLQWSASAFELLLSGVVLVALVARRSWARAIVIGDGVLVAASAAFWAWNMPAWPDPKLWLAASVASVAFLVPWRRGELTAAGWALALCAFAFFAVYLLFVDAVSAGNMETVPLAPVALLAYLAGAAGVLLRARWGSLALVVSAVATTHTLVRAFPDHPSMAKDYFDAGVQTLAVVALGAAAWLSSRTARSGAGTLRGLAA